MAERCECCGGHGSIDEDARMCQVCLWCRTYVVVSDLAVREWQADDPEHAYEQHVDAFPAEPVRSIREKGR